MTDTSKPVVRLETSSAAKKARKKAVVEAKEQTIKLAIRLNEGINEALRTLIRYRGDLSSIWDCRVFLLEDPAADAIPEGLTALALDCDGDRIAFRILGVDHDIRCGRCLVGVEDSRHSM